MEVVAIFKRYGWEWGGDWKFVDMPHFQKTFGKSVKQLLDNYNRGARDKNGYVII
jgi:peptidoglycan L-alanyl-D-glutamate endopeptidase CwlK